MMIAMAMAMTVKTCPTAGELFASPAILPVVPSLEALVD
jgi:hypothetical protein